MSSAGMLCDMPTLFAGTPTTVVCGATSRITTLPGAMPDADVAQHGGVCANHHAVADFRMAVAAFFARTAEGDAVQQRNVVAEDGGFADDDACAVVKHDAAPENGGGMDVYAEHFAGAVLQEIGKRAAVVFPQPVVDAVRLDGVETFEI